MKTLLNLLKSLLPTIESQQERDEDYLAGAVDICDLERRMHDIDERGRGNVMPIALGLYAR
jgi:hypothetical protein